MQGLIELYEASFDPQYLLSALELAELQNSLFYDTVQGGYFTTAVDDNSVPLRLKEDYDGAEPSANSVSALNLLRLSEITGEEKFSIRAEETIKSCGSMIAENSHALPQMLVALNFARKRKSRVILSGELLAPEMAQLRAVVDDRYLPGNIIMHASNELVGIQRFPESIQTDAAHPQASVCIDRACFLPINDPEILAEALDRVMR